MTHDPIRPLADIGRRVLHTARYLTTSYAPDRRLKPYESRLRDPLVSLSVLCDGVLERLEASPVAEQTEDFPYEPESRFTHARNPGTASPTFSRTGVFRDRLDESASARSEFRVEAPHAPSLDGPSISEEARRSIDGPGSSLDNPDYRDPWEATVSREPGEVAPQMEDPKAQPNPAVARRPPHSRDARYPVQRFPDTGHPGSSNGELYPDESGSGLSARKEKLEAWQTESVGARRSDAPREKVQRAAESGFPLLGSRLTASTERLAAMLRSHVADPEQAENQGDGRVFQSSQGADERGASHFIARVRTQPAGVEEIMERIADELETEFVRTYGRSGG